MAFWGAPQRSRKSRARRDRLRAQDARRICASCRRTIRALRRSTSASASPPATSIVGNFGGEQPLRLFGHRRHRQSRLAAGGLDPPVQGASAGQRETYTEAGAGYIARELGLVKVKGKAAVRADRGRCRAAERQRRSRLLRPFCRRALDDSRRATLSARQELNARAMHAERPDDTPVRIYLDKLAADRRPSAERDGLRVRDQVTVTGSMVRDNGLLS